MTSRVALIVVMTAAVFADSAAQQVQPTPLIQVDAIVTDAEGRPILGLKQSDFVLIDRKTQQVIDTFEEVSHPPVTSPVVDTAPSKRLIVIGLDDLQIEGKTREVKDMARRMVEQIGSPATLALVTASGTFGVGPTQDRSLLLRELDRFIDKFDPDTRPAVTMSRSVDWFYAYSAVNEAPNTSPSRDMGSYRSNLQSLKAIEVAARKIGTDGSRRKALIWFSGGIGAPGAEGCRRSVRDSASDADHACMAVASVMDRLRRSNVVAYAVDTGQLYGPVLKEMAEGSGGIKIDMKSFDNDLEKLISDLDHYYVLGFRSTNPKGGGSRDLEVRVSVPGATVRARGGYQQ